MRKAKKIKILESRVLVLEYQLDLLSNYITAIMDNKMINVPELDAEKWYKTRIDGNK